MIANAGSMGLDWRTLSLSAYMEALEAFNEMNSAEGEKPSAVEVPRMLKFMAAHTIQ